MKPDPPIRLAGVRSRRRPAVRLAYWRALNEATGVKDGTLRLPVLIGELDHAGYQAAARCLAVDLPALVAHLRYPLRHRKRWRSTDESVKGRGGRFERFAADGSVGREARRAADRLLWRRFHDRRAGLLDFRACRSVVASRRRLWRVVNRR
jgi:hypothetical protein